MALSACTAFAIVFFRSPLRHLFFWTVFITLMLPLEVRVVPTYAVAADMFHPFALLINAVSGIDINIEWNLLNSYAGLTLPLIATATGTFLYRQFFMTLPDELAEAARMDGSGPMRFFVDMILPLSRTNMLALTTIMFVYGWNQYLWPLLMVTDPSYKTVMMSLSSLLPPKTARLTGMSRLPVPSSSCCRRFSSSGFCSAGSCVASSPPRNDSYRTGVPNHGADRHSSGA